FSPARGIVPRCDRELIRRGEARGGVRRRVVARPGAVRAPPPPAARPLPSQGGPPWFEFTSQDFTLWTDAWPDRTGELIAELEPLRQAMIVASFLAVPRDGRIFVAAVSDQSELQVYSPD